MGIPHLIIVCTYIFYTWYESFMQINLSHHAFHKRKLSYHAFHKRTSLIMLFTTDSLQVRFRQLPQDWGREQSNSNSQWTPITKQDYKGGRNRRYFDGNVWNLHLFKMAAHLLHWYSPNSLSGNHRLLCVITNIHLHHNIVIIIINIVDKIIMT